MTVQPISRPVAEARRGTAAAPAATGTRSGDRTRPGSGVRGRTLLAALGLALAAAVLPLTAVHASPQAPDVENQFANPGGNPQPPEPPDPPQWGPEDLANPTEDPDPPLPPDPPDHGPDDLANPTENPEPPTPPEDADPAPSGDDSIPVPERVDAGFGGTALGNHQVAGLALIAAALVLALLVIVIARRHRSDARSTR
jgi:hypothetical protein